MMTESEKYRMSTYQIVKTLHKTDRSLVELVQCTLDGKQYVKKTYPEDKRTVFHALQALNCPHIPKIEAVFFGENTVVIEEYVPGKTLAQILESNGTFSFSEIKMLVQGLLSALSLLHANGIIHRDIKPANIILRESGAPVLTDFSIARTFDPNHAADTELLGTVGYAAPEQFGYSQSDERTDIFALGKTLEHLTLQKNAPTYLKRLVKKCTEFDPANRFQTVLQIKKDLKKRKLLRLLPLCAAIFAAAAVLFICLKKNRTLQEDAPQSVSAVTHERIVSVPDEASQVPCLQLVENETGHIELSLADGQKPTAVEARFSNGTLTVLVDETASFALQGTFKPEILSYEGGTLYSEIIFYDLNNDGSMEVLPIICNALAARLPTDEIDYLLRNYSSAWCIYFDHEEGWKLAKGEMTAYYDPFRIYAAADGCLWTDFPMYYTLEADQTVLKQ